MYGKQLTQFIVDCWGNGLSGENTVIAYERRFNQKISLSTVYRRRNSLTAQVMIDELIRQQLSAIARTEDEKASMKYRNELLKILLPVRIQTMNLTLEKKETKVSVNVEGLPEDMLTATFQNFVEEQDRELRKASRGTIESDKLDD